MRREQLRRRESGKRAEWESKREKVKGEFERMIRPLRFSASKE